VASACGGCGCTPARCSYLTNKRRPHLRVLLGLSCSPLLAQCSVQRVPLLPVEFKVAGEWCPGWTWRCLQDAPQPACIPAELCAHVVAELALPMVAPIRPHRVYADSIACAWLGSAVARPDSLDKTTYTAVQPTTCGMHPLWFGVLVTP
jgi:hypothetical protein